MKKSKAKIEPRHDMTQIDINYHYLMRYIYTYCNQNEIEWIRNKLQYNDGDSFLNNDLFLRAINRPRINNVTKVLTYLRNKNYAGYLERIDGKLCFFHPVSHITNDSRRARIPFALLSTSFFDVIQSSMGNVGLYRHDWFIESLTHRVCSFFEKRNFHLRKNGIVTYLPAYKKCHMNDNNQWSHSNRQEMKIGKAIHYLFKQSVYNVPFTENDISRVAEDILSNFTFKGNIDVVNGDKQMFYYLGSNYAGGNHDSLSQSCARYEESQPYVQLLADAPNVKMLVALDDDGYLLARANVYENANFETEDGHNFVATFCDRIYGKPINVNALRAYASDQGWITKTHQDYHNYGSIIMPNGNRTCADISVTLETNSNDTLVYMDTFKTGYVQDNGTKLKLSNNEDGERSFTDTDGNYFSANRVWVESRGEYVSEDDTVWSNIYDEAIHSDDSVYSDYVSTWIYSESSIYLDYRDTYVHDDCNDLVVLYNGDYALCGDATDAFVEGQIRTVLTEDTAIDDYLNVPVLKAELNQVNVGIDDKSQSFMTVLSVDDFVNQKAKEFYNICSEIR